MTDTTADSRTATGHHMAGQPDTATAARRSRRRTTGRDRRHVTPGRPRQVKIRYTDDEYATLADAARLAGLTPTGYAADAALAAAADASPPSTAPWRLALAELMAARGQVRRFGNNVNQAARALNALGEAPEWLDRAVAVTERAVARIDDAAAAVATAVRAARSSSRQRASRTVAHDGDTSGTEQSSRPMAGQTVSTGGQTTTHTQDSQTVGPRATRPDGGDGGDGAA
jgi:Bacterial mobilisation protein (MobC)